MEEFDLQVPPPNFVGQDSPRCLPVETRQLRSSNLATLESPIWMSLNGSSIDSVSVSHTVPIIRTQKVPRRLTYNIQPWFRNTLVGSVWLTDEELCGYLHTKWEKLNNLKLLKQEKGIEERWERCETSGTWMSLFIAIFAAQVVN
jgi:hypothetical protein